jgi:hypothetical protein
MQQRQTLSYNGIADARKPSNILFRASAAAMLVILPTARSQRAVFFRRRCSLSFIISLKSATGRISINPYFMPGCCEIS